MSATSIALPARAVARPGRVLAVVLAGQVMTSMDGSILAVALPSIRRTLDPSDGLLALIASGYFLTFGMLVVTGARLGAEIGHRTVWLGGLAGFIAASAVCGIAPSGSVLVGARLAQGAAGALVTPQVLSIVQVHFTGPERDRAIGLYSMVLALGVAAGQIAGGVLVGAGLLDDAWRPVFLVNVPIGVALLVVGRRVLPRAEPAVRSPLDLRGTAVLAAAMVAVLVPLVFGRELGWPWWAWVLLAGGLSGAWLFARVERGVEHPLLDLDAPRTPGVAAGLFGCCAVMGAYAALFFALALHLQGPLGFGPLRAGLAFVPYACGFAALSLTWTRLPVRALPVAGPLALAGGTLGVGLLARHGWPWPVTPLLVIAGAGHAAGYGPLVARITGLVDRRHVAEISGLVTTSVLLTSILAIATLGGIYLAGGGLTLTCAAVAAVCLPGAACAQRALSG
jgi:MFS family permease